MKKNLILGAKDIKTEEIDLSEFGVPAGEIFAKSLGAKRFQTISTENLVLKEGVEKKDAKQEDWETSDDFHYAMIVESVCDKDGKLIFTKEDVPELQEKSHALIMAMMQTVNSLNSLSKENIDKKEKK